MAKVKVHNKNEHPFVDPDFKGVRVEIPANSFIEMDFEEAIELKGKFTPIVFISEGNPDPRFFKKLSVDWPKVAVAKVAYVDPLTGKRYDTAAELADALREHPDHLRVKDDDAERAGAASAPNAELAALREQVEALTKLIAGQTERKGPGRPKKVANE